MKYLRYQLRVINLTWPRIWVAWEDELHDLSDGLGDDRDLFMLQNYIHKNQKENPGQSTVNDFGELLNTLIEGHRPLLQKRSLLLGEKLYYLKPGTFVAMVEAAWAAQLAIKS